MLLTLLLTVHFCIRFRSMRLLRETLYRILFSMSQYGLLHRACSRRNSRISTINETEKKSEFSLISQCEEK